MHTKALESITRAEDYSVYNQGVQKSGSTTMYVWYGAMIYIF